MTASDRSYASRSGTKLEFALRAFGIDARGAVCVDLGSHVGGFVDCLLAHGASRVYAVDPGYGILDYRLRRDPRVVVCERTNALSFQAPEPCHLVTIDVGWTPQRLILPAARRQLVGTAHAPGQAAARQLPAIGVVTLVKPQYEAPRDWLRAGVLDPARVEEVLEACRRDVRELRWTVVAETLSPLLGHGGNREFLWWLR
jgi:23S rRNA (cytidine1920-2'-O)/16S rRNA (cytidine1409-2'-O)-methyltransferase